MYAIIKNEKIASGIYLMVVQAPEIIEHFAPGQFVIVMRDEKSERIPLTIYDAYDDKVELIYQVVGASTWDLTKAKDTLFSLAGPLGKPGYLIDRVSEYQGKKVILVGGGIGIAAIYPQAKFLMNHGIKPTIIYGAKNREQIILEDKLRAVADEVIITTDDGSYQNKGFVTDILKDHLNEDFDAILAIGPLKMMERVSEMTRENKIKTIVSMNPIMVDGTGLCGACRVNVGGEAKFACVDGPEFDGHLVDFAAAEKRLELYREEERVKLAAYKAQNGDDHE